MQEQDFYEEENVQDQQQQRDPVRSHLKKLEAENKELRQLKVEAEDAKKKLAFVEAGIDLASPMAKYFVKAYDGDMTAEAIQAAAQEAKLTQPKVQQAQSATPQEQQAWNRTRFSITSALQLHCNCKSYPGASSFTCICKYACAHAYVYTNAYTYT